MAECGAQGDNLTYTYDSGVLTIEGTGAMQDFARIADVPWNSWTKYIKEVRLPEGLTSIGNYAFYECSNLETIEIPKGTSRVRKNEGWWLSR